MVYEPTTVDAVTFRKKVTTNYHYVQPLFDNEAIAIGANLVAVQDVQADKETTLFIKTTKNTQIDISFTYDTTADQNSPNWFTYCDSAGTAITLTCNNTNKAIPITMKGVQMRIIITNTDAAAGTVTAGLD